MTRTLRISAICALFACLALSSFAQTSPLIGTIIDVDEGRNRVAVEADAQLGSRIDVEIDSLSTLFQGFGTVIAGKPEIFTGSSGLANVRLGDRVEIRGTSTQQGVLRAQQVTLLGRQVPAPTTGVGQTRNPKTVDTPTTDRQVATSSTRAVEGTIRQINLNEGRVTIQTPDRRILSVRASRNTPVYFRGETYRLSNLEVGDRVKVETDPRDTANAEVVARSIEVTASVQETSSGSTSGAVVTIVTGRVTRVEPGLDYVYVDDGRGGEIRVDMRQAADANGEVIRARDVKTGDQMEISGSYNRTGDMFLASTVRFAANTPTRASDIGYRMEDERPAIVTITGTITETLDDAVTIGVRDSETRRVERIWVTDSFAVRTRGGAYVRADALRENDTAIIEAFRDAAGNLIAQTIRLRNR